VIDRKSRNTKDKRRPKNKREYGSKSYHKTGLTARKEDRERDRKEDNAGEDILRLEGRNPVVEALRSGRTIEKILIAKGSQEGPIKWIKAMAKDKGIVVNEVERVRLDNMSETQSHQGVIAIVSPYKYVEVDDILAYAQEKGEQPFIVVLDEIYDPHNLGSILRTAEACGVHGVIISKRRAVGLTPTVAKASAGAIEYVKVAKVTNISQTLKYLKDKGIWVAGADMDGEKSYFEEDMTGPIALVIGSEGSGIGKLVKENCDFLVKLPMKGKISSLNASVAGAVMMYEILRQRILKG
jgi:23S rRNA (guanosine2251-2'-O)-methyltransferase